MGKKDYKFELKAFLNNLIEKKKSLKSTLFNRLTNVINNYIQAERNLYMSIVTV